MRGVEGARTKAGQPPMEVPAATRLFATRAPLPVLLAPPCPGVLSLARFHYFAFVILTLVHFYFDEGLSTRLTEDESPSSSNAAFVRSNAGGRALGHGGRGSGEDLALVVPLVVLKVLLALPLFTSYSS